MLANRCRNGRSAFYRAIQIGRYPDRLIALPWQLNRRLASRSVLYDLLDAIRDSLLLLTIIHPVRSGPITITSDR
jgi:hypothetical protein